MGFLSMPLVLALSLLLLGDGHLAVEFVPCVLVVDGALLIWSRQTGALYGAFNLGAVCLIRIHHEPRRYSRVVEALLLARI